MMYRFFGLVWMMLLTQGPVGIYGQVELDPEEVKPISVFGCISHVDIKFRYFRETENNTGQLIAECDTAVLTCYLSNSSLDKYYSVKYTGKGGELVILEDNEKTRGNYSCCATYKSSSCVRRKITGPLYTHITSSHVSTTVENTSLGRQSDSISNATSKQEILRQNNTKEERKSDGVDTYPILAAILGVLIVGFTVITVLQVVWFCRRSSSRTSCSLRQQMEPLTMRDDTLRTHNI